MRTTSCWWFRHLGRVLVVVAPVRTFAAILLASVLLLGWFGPVRSQGAFKVDTTSDLGDAFPGDGVCATIEGSCSLRAAITEANASPGPDYIPFAIEAGDPGFDAATMVAMIEVESPLPQITETIDIDGFSQPGSPSAPEGVAIFVRGSSAASASPGLLLATSGSRVRGLGLAGFSVGVVLIGPGGGNVVEGVFFGTDALAGSAVPNGVGLQISGSNDNVIGSAGLGNILGGSLGDGLVIENSSGTVVTANFIGIGRRGRAVSNSGAGIRLGAGVANTFIGGLGAGNIIANNQAGGIVLDPNAGVRNTMIGNIIVGNPGLGIDLGDDGLTLNDAGDADSGPNDLLNTPEIAPPLLNELGLTFAFALEASAGAFLLDVFDLPSGGDPSGSGEGERPLGQRVVNHPGGRVTHFVDMGSNTSTRLSATITECDDNACTSLGSTSEFAGFREVMTDFAPVLGPLPARTDLEGTAVSFVLLATDADGDALTFALTGLPPGITADNAGNISGTLTAGAEAGSPFEVTVVVTDETGRTTAGSFTWEVAVPVVPTTTPVSTAPPTTTSTIPPTTATPPTTEPTTTSTSPTTAAPTTTTPPTTTPPTTTPPTTTTIAVVVPTTTTPPTTTPPTTTPPTTTTTTIAVGGPTTTTPPTTTPTTTTIAVVVPTTTTPPTTTPPTTLPPVNPDRNADGSPPSPRTAGETEALATTTAALLAPSRSAVPLQPQEPSRNGLRSSGSVAAVLSILALLQHATTPLWPLILLIFAMLSGSIVLSIMTTRRRLFAIDRPPFGQPDEAGMLYRSGAGPYWGWRRGTTARLRTELGTVDLPYADTRQFLRSRWTRRRENN